MNTEHRLTITRRFDASPERVFDAFLDPTLARLWLFTSPETDIAARRVEIDARVGGKWLMTNPCEGMVIEGIGEYIEIDRPRRLVFTFAIPMFGPHVDRIAVEIASDGSGCILSLTHEQLPPVYHSATESGWGKMFRRLDDILVPKTQEEKDSMKLSAISVVLPLCIATPDGVAHEKPGSSAAPRGHEWLQQLVGEWTYEAESVVDPTQGPEKTRGKESTRAIGGMWVVAETTGEVPGDEGMESLLTLGYDAEAKKFIGTFVASTMSYLWVYEGQLDDSGRVLTLVAEGPNLAFPGRTAKYRDVIEMESADHRIHRSSILIEDGTWFDFATVHYRRKAK
jgi:uncharacterized protein YndB with AHSA1/START domain